MTAHYGPSLPAGHRLTPAELASLAAIRATPSDTAPIMRTLYLDTGEKVREPMPWREAIDLEPDR